MQEFEIYKVLATLTSNGIETWTITREG